jgi:hypothetical protein
MAQASSVIRGAVPGGNCPYAPPSRRPTRHNPASTTCRDGSRTSLHPRRATTDRCDAAAGREVSEPACPTPRAILIAARAVISVKTQDGMYGRAPATCWGGCTNPRPLVGFERIALRHTALATLVARAVPIASPERCTTSLVSLEAARPPVEASRFIGTYDLHLTRAQGRPTLSSTKPALGAARATNNAGKIRCPTTPEFGFPPRL